MLLARAKAAALVASVALGVAACVGVAGSCLYERSGFARAGRAASGPVGASSGVAATASASLGREAVGFLRFGDWTYVRAPEWNAAFGAGELDFPRLLRARLADGKLAVEDVTKAVEGEREWAQVAGMYCLDDGRLVARFDRFKLVEIGEVTGSQAMPGDFRTFTPQGLAGPAPEGVRCEDAFSVTIPMSITLRPARWETGGRTENERYAIAWARSGFLDAREPCGMHDYDYHSLAYRRFGVKVSQFAFCHGLVVTDRVTGRSAAFRRTEKLHPYLRRLVPAPEEGRALTTLQSNHVSDAWLSGDRAWVGAFDAGLTRVDLRTRTVWRPAGSASIPKDVSALFERQGRLFVGTFTRGLFVLDVAGGSVRRVSGVPGRRITLLVPLGDELWVGTDRGVAVVDLGPAAAKPETELPGVAEARSVMAAARSGDAAALGKVLAEKPEVANALEADGRSALMLASSAGHEQAVRALLGAGARVDARDGRRAWTALHYAARGGHAGVATALLDAGAHVDGRRPRPRGRHGAPARGAEETPLHLAAGEGHDGVVKLLVGRGADVKARRHMGWTALHVAARAGKGPVVRTLLEAGAPANDTCGEEGGVTPLHCAAQGGSADAIEALLAGGADIGATTYDGTPLHYAATAGQVDAARALLDRGSDVRAKARRQNGDTPLHCAARGGYAEVVRLLVSRLRGDEAAASAAQARIEDGEARGELLRSARLAAAGLSKDEVLELLEPPSEIHEAAKAGDVGRARELIGADLSLARRRARTVWGEDEDEQWTPLHLAAKHGRGDMVHVLLASGADADVDARVRTGADGKVNSYTGLWFAALGKHTDIVRALLESGADANAHTGLNEGSHAYDGGETPLFRALDDIETAKLLLKHGADPNAHYGTEQRGVTPLHWAASAGRKEMVELLLAHGADPLEQDYVGNLAVRWAARDERKMEVVKLLLDHMPDIDVKDRYQGRTHLAWAAGERDVPLAFAELVVARGADVNATRTRSRSTALHAAVWNGHIEMVRFLLSKGAEVNARDDDGRTPLGCAVMAKARDVAGLLRQAGGRE